MTEFRSEIHSRIAQARAQLTQAHEAGDDFLVSVRLGELESLARLASDHDVEIDVVTDEVARRVG